MLGYRLLVPKLLGANLLCFKPIELKLFRAKLLGLKLIEPKVHRAELLGSYIVKRVSWFKSSLLLRIYNKHKHKH
jgi:hypothetical protein